MFYKREDYSGFKYVEDNKQNRLLLESKFGPAKIILDEYCYIEININENSWRICAVFEWLYRDAPPMIAIDEIEQYLK